MRENEFEKRVQQKMGDLDLSPSDAVWSAVERRIRKEKKRRFIFWWPLFFLLLGSGIAAGIIWTNKKEKNKTITAIPKNENSVQSGTPKTINETKIKNTDSGDTLLSKNEPIAEEATVGQQKTIHPETPTIVPVLRKQATGQITGEADSRVTVNSNKKTGTKPAKGEEPSKPLTLTEPGIVDEPIKTKLKPTDSSGFTKQAISEIQPAIDGKKIMDSSVLAKQEPVPAISQPAVSPPGDSTAITQNKKPAPKKTKSWEWAIALSAGRSNVTEGLRFFSGNLYADASNFQSGTGSNPPPDPGSPSLIRYSFSWSTGLYVKKSLSKKLEIQLGAGYNFLSAKMSTGSRVDSVRNINNSYSQGLRVSYFYRTGNSSTYTNQFYFLHLSADLSWKIINSKKFNLAWENGLAYNCLLGSTMLHYDGSLSGYYKNKKLLRQDQFFFSTALSLPAGERLLINPFLAISLTPVLKNTLPARTIIPISVSG